METVTSLLLGLCEAKKPGYTVNVQCLNPAHEPLLPYPKLYGTNGFRPREKIGDKGVV